MQDNGICRTDCLIESKNAEGCFYGFTQLKGQRIFTNKELRAMTLALNKSIDKEGIPTISQTELLRIANESK